MFASATALPAHQCEARGMGKINFIQHDADILSLDSASSSCELCAAGRAVANRRGSSSPVIDGDNMSSLNQPASRTPAASREAFVEQEFHAGRKPQLANAKAPIATPADVIGFWRQAGSGASRLGTARGAASP
jgi:hypothetical protein